jgi:hypothetical protein
MGRISGGFWATPGAESEFDGFRLGETVAGCRGVLPVLGTEARACGFEVPRGHGSHTGCSLTATGVCDCSELTVWSAAASSSRP